MARIDAAKLNLEETVVEVTRVSKVVKGGRRFSIRALVVVGDHNGHVGFGFGKASEYTEAIRKGVEDAKKHLVQVPLSGTTVPYMVKTTFGASEVLLKPAAPGTGVIAGGAIRAVVESAGIRDILTKTLGSTNKANTVQACIKALREMRSPDEEAARRGKTDRRRPRNPAQTLDYRDAPARVPTPGPRGPGPGLASGIPATRGSKR